MNGMFGFAVRGRSAANDAGRFDPLTAARGAVCLASRLCVGSRAPHRSRGRGISDLRAAAGVINYAGAADRWARVISRACRSARGIPALAAIVAGLAIVGCARRDDNTVKLTGSDTMVNLAEAWAEAFHERHPDVSLQVKGGGTGVGIAALCSGKIQIATASRPMKPKEIEQAKALNEGREPREFVVGRDALAIYVHKQNPLPSISLDQLAEIYGADGKLTRWKQLGVDNPGCADGEIVRVSRQNSSGTYAYFKEAVLGKKREYKQGATSQSGSSDVVALVSSTPCAIGYSGMGYRNEHVRVVDVARKAGEAPIEPNLQTALDGSYPISRPLYIYTLGEPTGAVQEFIDWMLSAEGQKIVEEEGYVPNRGAAAAG